MKETKETSQLSAIHDLGLECVWWGNTTKDTLGTIKNCNMDSIFDYIFNIKFNINVNFPEPDNSAMVIYVIVL